MGGGRVWKLIDGDCCFISVCRKWSLVSSLCSASKVLYFLDQIRWFYSAVVSGVVHGFGSWFETKFGGVPPDYSYEDVTLSTSPWQP